MIGLHAIHIMPTFNDTFYIYVGWMRTVGYQVRLRQRARDIGLQIRTENAPRWTTTTPYLPYGLDAEDRRRYLRTAKRDIENGTIPLSIPAPRRTRQ